MLKFKTSEVPFSQSVSRIEAMLALRGAKSILKEYDTEGRLDGLAFQIIVDGANWSYKMPARVAEIEKMLVARIRRPKKELLAKARAQAERTAWKLQAEWLEIEMTLIDLRQRDIREVFLPCLYDAKKGRTFFEQLAHDNFKHLLPEKT